MNLIIILIKWATSKDGTVSEGYQVDRATTRWGSNRRNSDIILYSYKNVFQTLRLFEIYPQLCLRLLLNFETFDF